MKIFLLCIVLCCCTLLGFKIKEYFKRRQCFYQNFCSFCERLQNKISFNNQKINLILQEEIEQATDKDFKKFLIIYLDYIKNSLNKDEFKQKLFKELCFLNKDEQIDFLSFLTNFGGLSKEEELGNISNYLLKFKNKLEEIKNKNEKFSNLYFKLFLILGLTIFVIFI